jgi:tRNA(fMet)-specific endonuclease VapC
VENAMSGKLLDTTVLIDLLRGHVAAADFVDFAFRSETPLCVSVISAMELVAGCRNNAEVEKVIRLVARFALIHLSSAESAQAYSLMLAHSKSHGLTIPDAFIAATAITHEPELATDNDRHFRMIPDLGVARPYSSH